MSNKLLNELLDGPEGKLLNLEGKLHRLAMDDVWKALKGEPELQELMACHHVARAASACICRLREERNKLRSDVALLTPKIVELHHKLQTTPEANNE